MWMDRQWKGHYDTYEPSKTKSGRPFHSCNPFHLLVPACALTVAVANGTIQSIVAFALHLQEE